MPPTFQLRVRTGPRDLERLPRGDDALGERVFGLLQGSLERGKPRPAMLLLRAETVDQVDVLPILRVQRRHSERMFAALAGQEGIEAAALVGMLQVRGRGMPAPAVAAVVYLEWPDNRWWTAWRFVDRERKPLGDEPQIRKAVDGWPRPSGMGGWFARARRTGVSLTLERKPAQVVH